MSQLMCLFHHKCNTWNSQSGVRDCPLLPLVRNYTVECRYLEGSFLLHTFQYSGQSIHHYYMTMETRLAVHADRRKNSGSSLDQKQLLHHQHLHNPVHSFQQQCTLSHTSLPSPVIQHLDIRPINTFTFLWYNLVLSDTHVYLE